MGRLAVVVILPEAPDDPTRLDFVSREFDTWGEAIELMAEVEKNEPRWRLASFCHIEDLPLLMEPPDAGSG